MLDSFGVARPATHPDAVSRSKMIDQLAFVGR
jgi:hypothetical protein